MNAIGPGRAASLAAPRLAWRDGRVTSGVRVVPDETPVALTYNRATLAVMLATPADLEDFAVGFSLTEGIIDNSLQIEEMTIVPAAGGLELRMWLSGERAQIAERRRRRLAGPSGCGLCGIESLDAAIPPVRAVADSARFAADEVFAATRALPDAQTLNHDTHAVHGAAFWLPGEGLVATREDVGRHNALDKLAEALARRGRAASQGILLLSSRLSVELVQKAAAIGVPVIAAVSAPTGLAIRVAQQAGITLVGVAREDGFEVFTHPDRLGLQEIA